MKKRMLLSVMALLLLSSSAVSAHPGRTDSNGGHTCRTNCERWGLEYGEYHYHGGGSSSSTSRSTAPKSSAPKSSSSSSSKPKETKPAYVKSDLKVYINGNALKFDSDPIIDNHTNLVPLRELAEQMGAQVRWNKAAGAIGVQREGYKMTLTIGSKTVFYNGKAETIAAAPRIINGVTYVPVQVFARGLGASLSYDESTNTLKITI